MSKMTKADIVGLLHAYAKEYPRQFPSSFGNQKLNELCTRNKCELLAIIQICNEYNFTCMLNEYICNSRKQQGKIAESVKVSPEMINLYTVKLPSALDFKLEEAVHNLNVDNVYECLENGANPNMHTKSSESLITILLYKEWDTDEELDNILEITKALIYYGVSLKHMDNNWLPRNVKLIKLLLTHGFDPDNFGKRIETGETLLQRILVCTNKSDLGDEDLDMIDMLLEYGADVNLCNWEGYSPFYYATYCFVGGRYRDIMLNMLQNCNPDCKAVFGIIKQTALDIVCNDERYDKYTIDVISMLLAKGADVNFAFTTYYRAIETRTYCDELRFPLTVPLLNKNYAVAKLLLDNGAIVYDAIVNNPYPYMKGDLGGIEWVLKYTQDNGIKIQEYIPTNPKYSPHVKYSHDDFIPEQDNVQFSDLPDILPNDVKELILNKKNEIEQSEAELDTLCSLTIKYTIPYINHIDKARLFKYHMESLYHKDLFKLFKHSCSVGTELVDGTNFTDNFSFETDFSRIRNVSENKIRHIVDILKNNFGAVNIHHDTTLTLRHKAEDTCERSVVSDLDISQKINQLVSKGTELSKLKGNKHFNENEYRTLLRNNIVKFVSAVKEKTPHNDNIMYRLRSIEINSVLFAKGLNVIDMEYVHYPGGQRWETKTIKIN